MRRRNSGCEQQ